MQYEMRMSVLTNKRVTPKVLESLILATNDKFTAREDALRCVVVVDAENKPKDIPELGILWQEVL